VETLLQRCVEQLAGTPPPTNPGPIQAGSDYTHYARSAEEIKETMAAEEGAVSKAPRSIPRFREDPSEVEIPEGELADPIAKQPPPAKKGWIL
jgi:hypothetical protein